MNGLVIVLPLSDLKGTCSIASTFAVHCLLCLQFPG